MIFNRFMEFDVVNPSCSVNLRNIMSHLISVAHITFVAIIPTFCYIKGQHDTVRAKPFYTIYFQSTVFREGLLMDLSI